MRIHTLLAPAAACLALAACDDSATSVVCPSQPDPSLVIAVLEARSGRSVAHEARGWWTAGAVSDSLRHLPARDGDGTVLAAFGPPGTYHVRVLREGAGEWSRGSIVVTEGVCGPSTAQVTAQMQALD